MYSGKQSIETTVKLGRCALSWYWVSIIPSLTQPAHEDRSNRRIVPGPPNLNRSQAFEPGSGYKNFQASSLSATNKPCHGFLIRWVIRMEKMPHTPDSVP